MKKIASILTLLCCSLVLAGCSIQKPLPPVMPPVVTPAPSPAQANTTQSTISPADDVKTIEKDIEDTTISVETF